MPDIASLQETLQTFTTPFQSLMISSLTSQNEP